MLTWHFGDQMLPVVFGGQMRQQWYPLGGAGWSGKNSDSGTQSLNSSSLLVAWMWVKHLTTLLLSFLICKKGIWLNRLILVKCLVQRPEQTKLLSLAIVIDYHHLWPQKLWSSSQGRRVSVSRPSTGSLATSCLRQGWKPDREAGNSRSFVGRTKQRPSQRLKPHGTECRPTQGTLRCHIILPCPSRWTWNRWYSSPD